MDSSKQVQYVAVFCGKCAREQQYPCVVTSEREEKLHVLDRM